MSGPQNNRMLVTSRVWLKVSNLRWVAGLVEAVTDKAVTIATEDGERVMVPRGSDKISQRTPKDLEAVDNLTTLPDLDEPNMLHSLCIRYAQNRIYTRTGPILVAMNPWTDLKLYGQDILHSYRRKRIDNVAPHVYAISEAAFANLQTNRKDQTILVSGDSGSGKTESTKFMMQYLAAVAHHTHTTHTEQQVLQCNPVLEAFGNAKTLRNDNSSRFGKYIDIHFDDKFALIGAKIDTYLLEKSRVVSQEEGERNFHIFYQLTSQAGVDKDLTMQLQLHNAEQYQYIKKGARVSVGYRPATSFQNTLAALEAIGISQSERLEIFKVLALVLHMGNLGFHANADDNAILHPSDPQAVLCARLLGVESAAFVDSILNRQIQAGPQGLGDSYVVSQTKQQAVDARDALARALYGNMFDRLVKRINQALLEQRISKIRTISILDIFGFEHFKTNHFEQFCINYANEKLQGHFNEFNFTLEIQEYQREQIQWSYDDFIFQTNIKCIELIEAKRTGMLTLLDEQCIMPNGNDETFCTKLQNELRDHPYLGAAKMKGTLFTIKHYAAEVVYDALGFCFKNKDPVQPAIVELLINGNSSYVRSLFEEHKGKLDAKSSGPRRQNAESAKSTIIFESVTAQFKRQLADLMTRIAEAQPHFVRCINPNSQKAPGRLEPEMILDQLRCSGLMEAVRVSRAGFPVRIPHEDFLNRFVLLTPRPPGDYRSAAAKMCQNLRLSPEQYRVGATKVFMRREIHERLEEDRSRLLVRQALSIQRVLRGHRARINVKKLRGARIKAAIIVEKFARRTLVRRWYLGMLEKRRQLMLQQRHGGPGPSPVQIKSVAPPPPTASAPPRNQNGTRNGNAATERSAPTSDSPPPANSAGKQMQTIQSAGIDLKFVEDLESQLNSVRELYYNERESQLALSNLVTEVCNMQSEAQVVSRIQVFEAKLNADRQQNVSYSPQQAGSTVDQAIGRRIDSLSACIKLLQDKCALLRRCKQAESAAAQAQAMLQSTQLAAAQAAAQTQAWAAQQATSAQFLEIQQRFEAARQELNRKDEAIILLHKEVGATKQQAIDSQEKLQELLKTEHRQQVEQLQQQNFTLQQQLEEAEKRSSAKEAATDGTKELTERLQDAQAKTAALENLIMQERRERAEEFDQMDAIVAMRDEQLRTLSERCAQLEDVAASGLLSAQAGYLHEAERMEAIARSMDGLAASLDDAALAGGVLKALQDKAGDCADDQRQLVAGGKGGEEGRIQMIGTLRHILESFSNVLARQGAAM